MQTTKLLVEANCKRVLELLNEKDIHGDNWYNSKKTELKVKMRELRRDTMKLEKKLYGRKS